MRHGHPMFNWVCYGVLVLMNLVDLAYTSWAVPTPEQEANPLMAWIMVHTGLNGVALAKGVFLGILFFVIPYVQRTRISEIALYTAVSVYTALTFYHLYGYILTNALSSEIILWLNADRVIGLFRPILMGSL